MSLKVVQFFIILFNFNGVFNVLKFQEHFQWKSLDYAFPSDELRQEALKQRNFIPENNLPVGIEIWRDKVFVTVPRWREGIPSTLNYVSMDNSRTKSPLLVPYPDFRSNELGNCASGLATVYRIKIDECNRLWVLDTGTFGIGNTTRQVCPYALNIFDLNMNRRIRRYELQTSDTNPNTFIANIAVDVQKTCNDAFAYLSDELGYGLIVYSFKENRSWRFSHSFFMPDPLKGDFNVDGLNFQWGEEGIFGLSLSAVQTNGFRVLFFSPLASYRQFAVSTHILQNRTKIGDSYHDFVALEERGDKTHTTAHVIDRRGIEYFNLIDRNAIGCWNTATPYTSNNIDIVDYDEEQLVFPSDIKEDQYGNIWVISDKMSTFLLRNLNQNEINFRIFFAPSHVLVHNTKCRYRNYLQAVELY